MSNQQNIKPNNSHELEFAYRSTYNSKNIRDERRKIIKSNQLSTMNHNYAPFLSFYTLHQRIIKKKNITHDDFIQVFFFWYPLNSNLKVPQIHGRGRKRINFVRRGCNNGFTMAHRERIHCVQSPPALETWKSWIFRCVPADIYVPSLHNSILPWQDRCLE